MPAEIGTLLIVRPFEHSFFLLSFASYVEQQNNFEETFSDWMKVS